MQTLAWLQNGHSSRKMFKLSHRVADKLTKHQAFV